jgi:hypothetical protein
VRLPLFLDVMRALILGAGIWLVALPLAAETWQAGDVAAAERYRAEERARAERYRAALEEGARPAGGPVERMGEVVAEQAHDLGESFASWFTAQLAAQLDELFGSSEPAPVERDLHRSEAPRDLLEWLARERERARRMLDRGEEEPGR